MTRQARAAGTLTAILLLTGMACSAPSQPSAPTSSAAKPAPPTTAPAASSPAPAAASPVAASASPSPAAQPAAAAPSPSAAAAAPAPGRWTFDSDSAGNMPNGAQAFSGQWAVRPEPDAPSQPN